MNYFLCLLLPYFQGALSRGQGINTLPSSASLRHGKTLSFHDHVLKKTKDVPSGLQNNPAATTTLAANQGGGLLDGSAGVRWMGADGGPVGKVEGDVVFAEERNSKAVTVQGRGLVGLEGSSGSSLPDGTIGKRWLVATDVCSQQSPSVSVDGSWMHTNGCAQGFYFSFYIPAWTAVFESFTTRDVVAVKQCRNGVGVWSGDVIVFEGALNGGIANHGRYNTGESGGQWEAHDTIVKPNDDCPQTHSFYSRDELKAAVDVAFNAKDCATNPSNCMNDWCVGAVDSFADLFYNMQTFNEDISSWDTSKVTDMKNLVQRTIFNHDINSWDTSMVTDMRGVFSYNQSFNQDISSWDTSQVTHMEKMFYKAYSFNQNLCSWGQDYSTIPRNMMFDQTPCADTRRPDSSDGPWCVSKIGCAAPGPWDISFIAVTADFGINSVDELIVDYEIGKDRAYETSLYEKDCTTSITDISFSSTSEYSYKNHTHGMLTVMHSFDKSMIANSAIWNATTSEIEICQVVWLIVPAVGTAEKMVISEDKRVVAIDFDLSVDFEINNITLGAATIESGSSTTDVTSYVEACKCGGIESFTCNTEDLVPNSELFVCIKSKSTDVEIDSLESMTITQGDETMTVIADERVVVPSITSRDYFPTDNVAVVSTRVPANLFTYAEGQTITISGDMFMKLADGNTRKLQTDIVGGGAKFGENKKAPFQLMIGLQDEMVLEEESYASSATGVASASKNVGMLVMVFASTYIML